jgi:hypothetical protein
LTGRITLQGQEVCKAWCIPRCGKAGACVQEENCRSPYCKKRFGNVSGLAGRVHMSSIMAQSAKPLNWCVRARQLTGATSSQQINLRWCSGCWGCIVWAWLALCHVGTRLLKLCSLQLSFPGFWHVVIMPLSSPGIWAPSYSGTYSVQLVPSSPAACGRDLHHCQELTNSHS